MKYFKMTDVFHPYIITFEDTEYLNLQFECIGNEIVKVEGTEESIAQWALRTDCVEITKEESDAIMAELIQPLVEPTEPVE